MSCACRSFGEPPPELLERIAEHAAQPPPVAQRRTADVWIESPWISGHYRGVVVARSGERAAFRVQLLPEVGTKVLDLLVTPELVLGTIPQAAIHLEHGRDGERGLERGFMAFVAASVAEQVEPLRPQRVRRARSVDEDSGVWELELVPALEGTRVRVVIDASGTVIERRFRLDGVGWSERWEPAHVFLAPRFSCRLSEERSQAIDAPPEELFLPRQPPAGARSGRGGAGR